MRRLFVFFVVSMLMFAGIAHAETVALSGTTSKVQNIDIGKSRIIVRNDDESVTIYDDELEVAPAGPSLFRAVARPAIPQNSMKPIPIWVNIVSWSAIIFVFLLFRRSGRRRIKKKK